MGIYAAAIVPYDGDILFANLPVTTMAPMKGIEDKRRIFSIDEILQENYGEDFHKAITCYVELTPEAVTSRPGFEGAVSLYVRRTRFNHVETVIGQPQNATVVDVVVSSVIEVEFPQDTGTGGSGKGGAVSSAGGQAGNKRPAAVSAQKSVGSKARPKRRHETIDFRMRYVLDMRKEYKCIAGPIVEPYRELKNDLLNSPCRIRASKYLLPIMYEEDYDRMARWILEKYYPEAIREGAPVCGMRLAARMGLKVVFTTYPEGSNILGQVYFDNGKVNVVNMDGSPVTMEAAKDTIYINILACRTREELNSTVIHECVHRYKDKLFFLLQCMAGREYTSYVNRRRRSGRRDYRIPKTEIDWMEMQAEKMPAHILMEKETTTAVIEELLSEMGGIRSPENMERIMCVLARRFHTTRFMAKIRMKQLGYGEAEGIYNFIDGKHIPDHGCSGPWPEGVTYTISPADLQRAAGSPEFINEISRRRYTYVEGHLCLDTDTFVHRWNGVCTRLTAYARRHIEQCCLGFSFHGRTGSGNYEAGVASRLKENKAGLYPGVRIASKPGTAEWDREVAMFSADSDDWAKIALQLTGDFKESFDIIRKAKGVSVTTLAERLGISTQYYSKMMKGRISRPQLVGICVELNIRYDISSILMDLSGNRFTYRNEDVYLLPMLMNPQDFTIERCNAILQSNGYDPLFPRSRNGEAAMAL